MAHQIILQLHTRYVSESPSWPVYFIKSFPLLFLGTLCDANSKTYKMVGKEPPRVEDEIHVVCGNEHVIIERENRLGSDTLVGPEPVIQTKLVGG